MPAATDVAIHRQAVVHSDGSVFGYAVHARVCGPHDVITPSAEERLVDERYAAADLGALAGDRTLLLRASTRMLRGDLPLPQTPRGLVVEVPASFARLDDAEAVVTGLRERGVGIALAGYTGSGAQDALLPLADIAKINLRADADQVATLVGRVHEGGAWALGERATAREHEVLATRLAVDLVQRALLRDPEPGTGRMISTGEAHHLELMRVLATEVPDHAELVRAVSVDPELSLRVLQVVNASATGISHHIDSLPRAVGLLGPRRLSALVTSVLVGGTAAPVDVLWAILTRATVCWRLAADDAGYTVGMLSGVAAALDASIESLVERAGVSAGVAAALTTQTGPLGPALRATLAHEADDHDAVTAAGFDAAAVARLYLQTMPEALSAATTMTVGRAA